MTFEAVQMKTAVSTVAGTAITATFDTPPTEGNMMLATVMHTGLTTVGMSNWGWYYWTGNTCSLYMFEEVAGPSESSTFLVTHPGPAVTWAVCIKEYSSNGRMAPDAAAVDSAPAAGASTYTLGMGGIRGADDLAVVAFAHNGAPIRTATAWSDGFTEVCDLTTAAPVASALAVADKFLTTTGVNPSCQVTLSGTVTNIPAMMIYAFSSEPDRRTRTVQQQLSPGGW